MVQQSCCICSHLSSVCHFIMVTQKSTIISIMYEKSKLREAQEMTVTVNTHVAHLWCLSPSSKATDSP